MEPTGSGSKDPKVIGADRPDQEREDRYAVILQTAMDGFWLADRQGRLLQVNDAYCRMSGYSAAELRSMSIVDLDVSHDREGLAARMREIMAAGQARFETSHRRKDGTRYDVEVSTQYRPEDGGAFVAFLRDISERKRAEAALNELKVTIGSQHVYSVIVEKAADGFWLLDKHFMTVYVNHALETMLGYAREEMIGRSWYDFGDPEWVERARELERRRERGVSEPHHFLFIHKGGRRVLTRIATTPLYDRDGNFNGALGILSDITRQKEAEEALKIKDLLNAIASSAGIAMCIINPDYTIAWYNEMHERWFGALDKTVGRNCFEVFERRDAICPDCPARVSFEKGAIATSERSSITTATGRDRIIASTTSPIRDADGAILQVVEIAQDITERKHAEQALKDSDERFKAAQRTARIGNWERRISDGTVAWSDELYRIFDIPREDGPVSVELFLGRIHPDDREEIKKQIESRVPHRSDYRIVRADGAVRYIHEEVELKRDADGTVAYVAGTAQDVTEQKRAEERLRESERFVRNILDTVDEGFLVVDRDYRITTANRAYCEQVSRPYDDVIGRHCYAVSHHASQPCFAEGEDCAVRRTFADGGFHAALHEHRGPGGAVFYTETKAFPLKDGAGTVTSAIEVITNITERHLLEDERLKTQKLEAIGTLAGGIAHDFNNLLQGVFGCISLAKTQSEGQGPLQATLRDAEKALHLAVRLTNQLLTFSKGGMPVRKPVDLRPVIGSAAMFALSGSRTSFRLSAQEDLWLTEADEGQISQVIQNIVLNADQAMPEGGEIEITARNREAPGGDLPKDLAQGRHVEIAVTDTGVGIHEKDLRKIFDPYFTTKEKGSGLGLATAYSIVKNHNGAIDVRSERGKGSTFRVHLPAATGAAPEAERSGPAARTSSRRGRILVMDDERLVLNVAGRLVKALGHEVELAANGVEALARYEAARRSGKPFDVAILDLTIRGGMGGTETLERLLEMDPQAKAVVSSGYSDDSAIASYEKQGFKAVLNKPYNIEALREILDRLLGA